MKFRIYKVRSGLWIIRRGKKSWVEYTFKDSIARMDIVANDLADFNLYKMLG